MNKCKFYIKTPFVDKPCRCLKPNNHAGRHIPNLTGLHVHNYYVVKRAKNPKTGWKQFHTLWLVKDGRGDIRIVSAADLFSSRSTGIKAVKGLGCRRDDGKHHPEYSTIRHHFNGIFNSKPGTKEYRSYHGVPFCDDWNPSKGGSYLNGMKWILDNLGPKPKEAQLHLVSISKGGKGFGPWRAEDGGWSIRWLTSIENQLIENKRYVEYGNNKDFAKEAKRRGFKLVPLS